MASKCADHCRDVRSDSHISTNSLLEGIHYRPCESIDELENIVLDLDEYLTNHNRVLRNINVVRYLVITFPFFSVMRIYCYQFVCRLNSSSWTVWRSYFIQREKTSTRKEKYYIN